MSEQPTSGDVIDAIRGVRLAAHELANVCSAMVGGTEMAIEITTVPVIGDSLRGIVPKPLEKGVKQ